MKEEETDNFSPEHRLKPADLSFTGKARLKRSVSELPLSQVEYLSAAFLENDLSALEAAELEENLKQNSANRQIFDSIQLTRLKAPAVTYKYKSSLRKLSPGQRLFRIAAVSLSAAASIGLLILFALPSTRLISGKKTVTEVQITDSAPVTLLIASNEPIMGISRQIIPRPGRVQEEALPITIPSEVTGITEDSPVVSVDLPSSFTVHVPEPGAVTMEGSRVILLASGIRPVPLITNDDRGPVRKFIAATFREKILREDHFTDEKLRPYEVAKAGVEGFNRLFDWEMQITENLDESGAVSSVNFSSTLLSFNAPVKKTGERQ